MIFSKLLTICTLSIHIKIIAKLLKLGCRTTLRRRWPPLKMTRQICRIPDFGYHCRNECSFYPVMFHINENYLKLSFYTPNLSRRIMVWRRCLSVRLSVLVSVCGSVRKACKHDRDWTVPARTVKLGTHTTYDKKTNPNDFQGQGSKVKVTCWTLLLNLVNRIQTEPFQLGPLNLVHILLMTRGQHLLIFKVMGKRSRSEPTHSC